MADDPDVLRGSCQKRWAAPFPQQALNQDGMGVETFKMKLNLTNIREEKQSRGLSPPWGSAVTPRGPIPPHFLPKTRSS